MISRFRARDFQSLHHADLEFGRFTVVIGPTNSGKSAVLRAVSMLAHNVDSPVAYVSHGAKTTEVGIETGDADPIGVSVIRGKAKSEYRLTYDGEEVQSYPKAGKDVPTDVAEVLCFVEVEGEDLNFAFQFDRPFLLSVPATTAAKVLGDLTNVNRIFAAVREAARRRLETQAKLKVRRGDLERVREAAQAYADLPAQQRVVAEARERLQRVQETVSWLQGVETQLGIVYAAQAVLRALEEQPLPEIVPIARIEERVAEVQRLAGLIRTVQEQEGLVALSVAERDGYTVMLESLDSEYHSMLKEAGTCPVCGATIS